MQELYLSRLHFPVTVLGPGQRVGIWFQGCSLRCPGCISADTWAAGRGRTTVAAVLQAIHPWLKQADGVTISGGEPFEQPDALVALLRELRPSFDGDILVYSGFEASDIADVLPGAEGLLDALITGPYMREVPQTLPLRGSDNQQLHTLTDLGRERFAAYSAPVPTAKPALDVMFDDDGTVWFAGIPGRGDFERMSAMLSAQGHKVVVSTDRSISKEAETEK